VRKEVRISMCRNSVGLPIQLFVSTNIKKTAGGNKEREITYR
jgi:hypothetical protein